MGYIVTPTIVFLPIAPLASWWDCHIAVACGGFFIPTFPEDISVLNVFQIKSSHLWPFIPNGCLRSLSYFSLQETSAKPCGALDILIAVNASQLKNILELSVSL